MNTVANVASAPAADKDLPSYEEAMHASVNPPTQIGIMYPNAGINVNIHQGSAPPQFNTGYLPTYGSFETTPVSVVVHTAPQTLPPELLVINGCPACRIGFLEDNYPCMGLLCAIVFFPVGILCCLAMKSKRCSNCGTEF